eukprot:m.15383 g.15383  ORF g.15383 m.15383 type:complete len:246 (-) comp4464_c0_seq1:773-1510(-)
MRGWQLDLLKLGGLLVVSSIIVYGVIIISLWPMPDDDWEKLTVPTNLDRAKDLRNALRRFQDEHFLRLLVCFTALYLFMQSFAIPGTGIANVLGGALFGFPIAVALGITYCTIGAVIIYHLSYWYCQKAVEHYFPERLAKFRELIKQSDNLLLRLTSLRIFPFTPHWFVSIACGQLHAPMISFIPSSFAGQIPYTLMGCHAGTILKDMESMDDVMKPEILFFLTIAALVGFVLPILLKKYNPLSS